jgi:hypothetical protein
MALRIVVTFVEAAICVVVGNITKRLRETPEDGGVLTPLRC